MWIGEVDMKTWIRNLLGILESVVGAVDVVGVGAGQGGDHRSLDFARDAGHRLEVARGGSGKTGFEDVDAEASQLMGDRHLLFGGESDTGRLLPIAQGRVENDQSVREGL